MTTLDSTYELLVGEKHLSSDGLWKVYNSSGTELTSGEGMLPRGNQGALLWKKTPIATAVEKSGVQRLWMYELYAQSIEEDHKKRGLIKDEAKPTVEPTPAPIKAKPARTKPRKRQQEQKPLGKPLPVFARTQPAVFTYSANEAILQTQLDDVIKAVINSPLPKFISVKPHRKVVEQQEIVQRENEDEEEFLLLAA